MLAGDFGLIREEKIKRSGVREVFTPHRPINKIDFFFGRQREVKTLIEQLNTPGQHSLLYGERRVGKSSSKCCLAASAFKAT